MMSKAYLDQLMSKSNTNSILDVSKAVARSKNKSLPNGIIEKTKKRKRKSSLIKDIMHGPFVDTKRHTQRYSFEIYTDLVPRIEELQYLFRKRTGRKLPSSRIVREAIEVYID